VTKVPQTLASRAEALGLDRRGVVTRGHQQVRGGLHEAGRAADEDGWPGGMGGGQPPMRGGELSGGQPALAMVSALMRPVGMPGGAARVYR